MTQPDAARGIRFLCAGVFVFSLQDAVVKQVSGDYPLTEVMTIRSLVALPILLVLVQLEAGWRAIFTPHFRSLVARAGLMFGAYTTYYMAFPAMNLAYAVALYFTVPLFVTALAGPFLGEKIGLKVWAALAVGFGGVLVILQPGSGLFEWAALLSLMSALMYATSMLMARRIGTAQPASVMTFYQNGVFLAGALVIAACTHWMGIEDAGHPSISFLVRPWVWPTIGRWHADRVLRRHRVGRHVAADQCLPDQPGQPGDAVRIHRHPVGAVVGFSVFRRGAAVDHGHRVPS